MKRFDSAMKDRLTAAVGAVEAVSGLEVVVRVVPRSGSYRDVVFLAGTALGLLVLASAAYLPVQFDDLWLVPNVLVAGALGALAGWKLDALVRLLTTERRRRQQVLDAAHACFVTHAVSGTRQRTGVLLYASVLEDRIEVLPDFGAEGAAPRAEWQALGRSAEGDIAERILAVMGDLRGLGQRHVHRAADDVNELPDGPSIG